MPLVKEVLPELPFELWVKIFRYVPPVELYTTVLHVCPLWRRLILNNRRSLPLIQTHCRVYIMDEGSDQCANELRDPLMDPLVQYTFISCNTPPHGLKQKQWSSFRDSKIVLRTLHVSAHLGEVAGEIEPWSRIHFSPTPIDAGLTRQCLSFMCIRSACFDVYAHNCRKLQSNSDERLTCCYMFLESNCGRVDLRSLWLSSKNPLCRWQLGPRSRYLLGSLHSLRRLELTNIEDTSFMLGNDATSLHQLKELALCADTPYVEDSENVTVIAVDSGLPILENLMANTKQTGFSFSAFVEQPSILLAISARNICTFIQVWQSSLKPWYFEKLSFNALVSPSEFHDHASRLRFFEKRSVVNLHNCTYVIFIVNDITVLIT
ncbi:unnamed protein product [Toxocara canis]|uniref:F-box domain-containing protein n=1 Tax=Toxocara canis TaxID=6265 RepID=A0A183UTU3_TOXCA|nr:unnamed protein product [Toxocara canis]